MQSNLCCYIILKFGTSTSLKLAEGPQSDRFFCKAGHSFLIVLLCMLWQKQLMEEIKYFFCIKMVHFLVRKILREFSCINFYETNVQKVL